MFAELCAGSVGTHANVARGDPEALGHLGNVETQHVPEHEDLAQGLGKLREEGFQDFRSTFLEMVGLRIAAHVVEIGGAL